MSSDVRPFSEAILHRATRRGRLVIATTVLGSGMALLDSTVVNIALPAIGRQFHTTVAGLQWVVTGYLLTLSGLLLLGGSLGDRYGRRRVYLVGVGWFALASLGCSLAPDEAVLVIARAVQGMGAALLAPGSLAILQSSFVAEDRAAAIGAWTGLGGLATAAGPFLGGWLISAVSWRMIFLINVPVAAAVLVLGGRNVPESRNPGAGRLDVLGAVLVTAGLVGVVFALIEGSELGWQSADVLGPLLGGSACLGGFGLAERLRQSPLLPLELFNSRQFSAANAVTLVLYGALGGSLFLLPVELEQVGGYSPLAAGAATLPVTVIMLIFAARFGALASRIGPRIPMTVGPIVVGAGLALLVRVGPGAGYLAEVLPAMLLFGLGLALAVAPLTATVLSAAPARHSGIASAVNNDVARLAGLVAVAALPLVAGLSGRAYLEPARFSHGFHLAMLSCAGACLAGGLLSLATIGNAPPDRRSGAATASG